MFKVVRWILKAGIAGVVSLIILSAITIVYSHPGVHVSNETWREDFLIFGAGGIFPCLHGLRIICTYRWEAAAEERKEHI